MKREKLLKNVGSFLGFILFCIAVYILNHELKTYHISEIINDLKNLSPQLLSLSILLTVISYAIMTGYDYLALKYINVTLEYKKTAFASFVGYAFSNNIGLSMLAGGSIRYRLYSMWGLGFAEITRIIAFCTMTLWLGFLLLSGLVFLFEPFTLPESLHLPFHSLSLVGIILLLPVAVYVTVSMMMSKPFKIANHEVALPPLKFFLPQMLIALLDWGMAGYILYILLPSAGQDLSFLGFLSYYLLAILAGMVSQIPGGLGVFETIMLLLLTPQMPATSVMGSLLVYRVVYYFLPLFIATLMLGIQEALHRKDQITKLSNLLSRGQTVLVPNVLTLSTFFGGIVLLFSGATPAAAGRLKLLEDVIPLPVIEFSHFLGSLAGVALLLLARGLQRRIDGAYFMTIGVLLAGVIFSLLKGFDYEEATILSIMLVALLPCRHYFYRKASLISERFTWEWIVYVSLVLVGTVWLSFFSYKHMEYSNELWWRFTFFDEAPRTLRALVGVGGMLTFFGFMKLLHPAYPKVSDKSRQADLDRALPIIKKSKDTYANLSFLGDKQFFFNKNETAFIMYGHQGKSWVSMGDPIGPVEELPELLWSFRNTCDRYDVWPVFYEVRSDYLSYYLDMGLRLIKLGEEARIPLVEFALEGNTRKSLRHSFNRAGKEGCHFEIVPRESITSLYPDLRIISDSWLGVKKTREKGFSLGFYSEDYLKNFPTGIVRWHDKIVAFANIWESADHEELSVDLMRFLPEAPSETMDYLFIELMLWGRREGYRWFNLGMAPLSGFIIHPGAPLWSRAGAFVFNHGEQFYNFKGLRHYKEKFNPEWKPKYLAFPGSLKFPLVFSNIAALVSRGLKGVVGK